MLYGNKISNQRESGIPYTRNAAQTQFERTMKREGRIVVTYTSGTEFRAFFRRRDEHENQRESVIMYYDVTAPVRPGTLVMIGYGVFLALNRETTENDIYYKSTLIKCNGVFNENTGIVHNVPFYCSNMKSSVSVGNNVISMLNGNLELITEENSLSKQIDICQTFNEFGRTFEVTNKYTIDGIVHVIGEVYSDVKPQIVYSIKIDGMPNTYVEPNATIQLSATPYINGSATTGATFDWISADNSIAIVDNTGKVTALSEGTVKITVTWIEKDISEFVYITVANENVPPILTYKYSITGNTNLRNSYKRTYTLSVIDNDGNSVNNIDFQWNVVSDFEVYQNAYDYKIELLVDDEDKIESTLMLQAIVNGEVKAEIKITVTE